MPQEKRKQEYCLVRRDILEKSRAILHDVKTCSRVSEATIRGLLLMMHQTIEQAADVDAYALHACIAEAASLYSHEDQSRITLVREHDFSVQLSKLLMVELLRNLLSNSLVHAGAHASILIWCDEQRRLYIQDNGKGMNADLFDGTYGAPGSPSGMGLGLVFCRKVMQHFGYTIRCESEPGRYTLFILDFSQGNPNRRSLGVTMRSLSSARPAP